MKKYILGIAAAIIAAVVSFSSCEKAESSVIPHISGLTFESSTFKLGDRGEATLTFDQTGANIKGRYKYTITPGDISGTFNATPTKAHKFQFDTPAEPGTYTIKVVCTFVDIYSGYQISYQGSMSDIGTASATFTIVDE